MTFMDMIIIELKVNKLFRFLRNIDENISVNLWLIHGS